MINRLSFWNSFLKGSLVKSSNEQISYNSCEAHMWTKDCSHHPGGIGSFRSEKKKKKNEATQTKKDFGTS